MSEPRPVLAVGAVVVSDGRLLMIRRGKEPGKGLWSIPGGRVERGEYVADAVRREVKEETGIDVEVERLAGILEVPGDEHYVILDFVAHAPKDADPAGGHDADDARWVPFAEIEKLDCTPRLIETLSAWKVLTSAGEERD